MKRTFLGIFVAVVGLFLAAPAYAQEAAGEAAYSSVHWVALTAGFSMAIASAVCAIAQGRAVAAACEGVARNPGARPAIQFFLILGLVLIESLALYTFAIIFAKVI
jgi:F-type H+-transporting ATPase subunit c